MFYFSCGKIVIPVIFLTNVLKLVLFLIYMILENIFFIFNWTY